MILDREDIVTVIKLIITDIEKHSHKVELSEFKRVGMLTKEVTITHEDYGTIVLTN